MKTMKNIPCLLAAALLLAAGIAPARAHDAWVAARADGLAVVYGHDGKLETCVPEKIRSVVLLDASGQPVPARRAVAGGEVRLAAGGAPALAVLHYDNGVWTKTADGSKNLPKNAVPGALSATHSVKYGKTVLRWGTAAGTAQGQALEIVPLAAAAPAAGKTLAVRVLRDGRPLPGAKLLRTGHDKEAPPFETDADGRAEVPVVAGWQALSVAQRVELRDDPHADALSLSANLHFEAR